MGNTKSKPQRKCIGCGNSFNKDELIRVSYFEDVLSLDITGKQKGRGVYICKDVKCAEAALKKGGFQRSFKKDFNRDELSKLVDNIKALIEQKQNET